MVKVILMLSIIGATASVWAVVNKTQEIDATTKATVHNIIKFVTPIKVTGDSAVIKWTDAKNRSKYGTIAFTYETGDAAVKTRTVTSQEATALSFNLTGLSPKTTYKIRLEVSDSKHTPCADTATITTVGTTSAEVFFNSAKKVPLELLDHSVRLGATAKLDDHIMIADCQGRKLLDHHVKSSERDINLPTHAKGVYFLTYTREGKLLDQKQFVITHK
jgi:hypothetical protein